MGWMGVMSVISGRCSRMACAIALFAMVMAATAAPSEDCVLCHTAPEHREVALTAKHRCNDCHRDIRSRHGKAEDVAVTASVREELAIPQYYEESRLGDKPNPMVLIPAGPFVMGWDDRLPDEGPSHVVTLPAYYIDLYEVTNLQYKAFIDATGRRSPAHFRNRTYPAGKADHPVTYVTWYDARDYCTWAGKRLPTEAEWEKAARGTDGRMFPWGNEFNINYANTPQRWARLGREGDTTPVGAFPQGRSPYGLYDMSGNVWEWTASWYQPHPGNTHPSESYGEKYKVLKGGSWWDCSFYKCGISAPVFNRAFFLRSTRNKSFGFRCAADAVPGQREERE